ncbi:hypothetical protein T09_3533 [Trichinella sp. T9]|nr:hypothetical protein T09_3533 [Trichinella sp. T9]
MSGLKVTPQKRISHRTKMHSYKIVRCMAKWTSAVVGCFFIQFQRNQIVDSLHKTLELANYRFINSWAYEENSNEFSGGFIFVDPGMLFERVITVMNMHPLRVLREGRPVVNFQPDRHAWTLIVLVKVR